MVAEHAVPRRMKEILGELRSTGSPVVLVGHTIHNDLAWLADLGASLDLSTCDIGRAYQSQEESVML